MMIRALALVLPLALWAGGLAAQPVRLTLLHVNDIYQHQPTNGQGGLAQLLTLVDGERGRSPAVALTFGGDLLSPSLASSLTKGAHMIEFFNGLGPVAAVPGNHEFDFGAANFAERIAQSRFPWVAGNILAADGTPFGGIHPWLLSEIGGIKVGFLGVLTTDTGRLTSAVGVTFTDEQGAARAGVERLRAQGAEVVIALTHQDLADDRRLALRVKGIDLILGGHDHDAIAIKEDGPLIVKAGHDAQWLAAVELEVERPEAGGTGPAKVRPVSWRFMEVAGVPPSPALAPLAASVDAMLDDALGQPLATLGTDMDSRGAVVRSGEAAIGNLFSDALRAHFKADAALINGGGLRGNRTYAPGMALSRRDILAEMPFGNAVMALELSGAQLRDAVEHGLSAVEDKAGRFPQVSGMAVRYDPSRPAGTRVRSITIGGRPLDPGRLYRLATSDYLGRGGDGYGVLTRAKVVVDASGGPLLANVVADYLAAMGTVSPRVEGRVVPTR